MGEIFQLKKKKRKVFFIICVILLFFIREFKASKQKSIKDFVYIVFLTHSAIMQAHNGGVFKKKV